MAKEIVVKLGQKVRDTITGLEGIAVARTVWMYGCVRITVQPMEVKEGKPAEMVFVDEPQLEIVREKAAPEAAPAHGPRSSDPGRPVDRR